jgi:hypothetical protein
MYVIMYDVIMYDVIMYDVIMYDVMKEYPGRDCCQA